MADGQGQPLAGIVPANNRARHQPYHPFVERLRIDDPGLDRFYFDELPVDDLLRLYRDEPESLAYNWSRMRLTINHRWPENWVPGNDAVLSNVARALGALGGGIRHIRLKLCSQDDDDVLDVDASYQESARIAACLFQHITQRVALTLETDSVEHASWKVLDQALVEHPSLVEIELDMRESAAALRSRIAADDQYVERLRNPLPLCLVSLPNLEKLEISTGYREFWGLTPICLRNTVFHSINFKKCILNEDACVSLASTFMSHPQIKYFDGSGLFRFHEKLYYALSRGKIDNIDFECCDESVYRGLVEVHSQSQYLKKLCLQTFDLHYTEHVHAQGLSKLIRAIKSKDTLESLEFIWYAWDDNELSESLQSYLMSTESLQSLTLLSDDTTKYGDPSYMTGILCTCIAQNQSLISLHVDGLKLRIEGRVRRMVDFPNVNLLETLYFHDMTSHQDLLAGKLLHALGAMELPIKSLVFKESTYFLIRDGSLGEYLGTKFVSGLKDYLARTKQLQKIAFKSTRLKSEAGLEDICAAVANCSSLHEITFDNFVLKKEGRDNTTRAQMPLECLTFQNMDPEDNKYKEQSKKLCFFFLKSMAQYSTKALVFESFSCDSTMLQHLVDFCKHDSQKVQSLTIHSMKPYSEEVCDSIFLATSKISTLQELNVGSLSVSVPGIKRGLKALKNCTSLRLLRFHCSSFLPVNDDQFVTDLAFAIQEDQESRIEDFGVDFPSNSRVGSGTPLQEKLYTEIMRAKFPFKITLADNTNDNMDAMEVE